MEKEAGVAIDGDLLKSYMMTSGKMQQERETRKTIIRQQTMEGKRHSLPVPSSMATVGEDLDEELEYERPDDFEEDKDELMVLKSDYKVKLDNQGEALYKKGYVEKRSPSFFKGWQRRYLELVGQTLSYFKNTQEDVPRGSLCFDKCEAEVVKSGKDNRIFEVRLKGVSRTFEFRLKSEEDCDEWVRKIGKSIAASKGTSEKLRLIGSKFWKGLLIREEELIKQAQTGDIILFRSKTFNSRMQRSLTRSYYDHVGMLMNFKELGLYLFEATLNDGVGLTSWNDLRPYIPEIYHRVAYRRLNMERTPLRMSKLETFLHDAYGKQYHISVKKLMQRKSVVGSKPDLSSGDGSAKDQDGLAEDRTFFCSELIAKAYKEMGILETEKASCQFWPVSFTQRKELPFVDKISLGEEYAVSVDMDKPVIKISK